VQKALRLLVYDVTQRARKPAGLGLAWQVGSHLYRGLGRLSAAFGATSFESALRWIEQYEPEAPISELQFWGHGKWGRLFIDRDVLDASALRAGHPLRPRLDALRERLTGDALLWFRTCETFGARRGQDFAAALADFSGATVAGHTFVIGFFQSGLHVLRPGMQPHWSPSEGLARGTPDHPELALRSGPRRSNTVTALTGRIPSKFAGG
jgi:hypothetical protein